MKRLRPKKQIRAEAKEIINEHKAGKCIECFEGECMDEAKGYLFLSDFCRCFIVGMDLKEAK